jgi:hypothetical protein
MLTYAILLDSLTVVYIQFVIMLRELKKVLSVAITLNANNLKWSVCVASYHSPVRMNHTKYNGLEINVLYRDICIMYRNVYILYIRYIYASEVYMSASVIVICYIR